MANAVMKNSRLKGEGATGFIRKLSRGLMLPIALLPIAGLFLGIGAGVVNVLNTTSLSGDQLEQASFIFVVMQSLGQIIFDNLPVLFCLGVALAFAEEAGVAVFAALVGWMVFNVTQSTMIWENADGTFRILWYSSVSDSVVTQNMGILSMQTSVFGGIIIGVVVAFLYNKFHKFEAPQVLGFFSGTRFVPIITFLITPFIGFAFLMIWPILGTLIEQFGKALVGMPFGTDSLVFGIVERSLIPFGLHHAFYTPLWYTSAGGVLTGVDSSVIDVSAEGNQLIWFEMQSLGIPLNILDNVGGDVINSGGHAWQAVLADEYDPVTYNNSGLTLILKDGTPFVTITNNVNPGSYMQGKFPFMLAGLPAAGVAMIMAAKKENRQVAASVIGAAAITSFLTGITEPIEFTFLFVAPLLYYGFHIWAAGISFWLLDILGCHSGITFSGGIFDFVLFGIIPDATGLHSNCYWILVVAVFYAALYFVVFYAFIIKFDVKTPGRDDAEVALVSKADYQKSKKDSKQSKKITNSSAQSKKNVEWDKRVDNLLVHLGGLDNLEAISACITKLRLIVKDRESIKDDALMKMGAKGVVGKGKSVMVVFGVESDKFKVALLERRKIATQKNS